MNIALVIERMDPSRGGRETSTAGIAVRLAGAGHEVHVFCQEGSLDVPGVDVHALGKRGPGREWELRNFYRRLESSLSDRRYDVVHSMMPLPGADIYQPRGGTAPARLEAARRRRGGGVSGDLCRFFSRLDPARRLIAKKEKAVARDAAVLSIPNSEMVAGEFRVYYNRCQGVRVIFNGVDIPRVDEAQRREWRRKRRAETGCPDGEPLFLTVAKNLALKGVSQAIDAYGRWRRSSGDDRGGKLVIVGGCKTEPYVQLARDHGVAESVVFAPFTDAVFEWYSAADACLLLSWYDACSRVVLEATRWGVPSITTVYNGAAEALASGAGIVVSNPADSEAVSSAMEELADDEIRRDRASVCRTVADSLSMERHVSELLAVYESMA